MNFIKKLLFSITIVASAIVLSGCQSLLEYKSKAGLQVITDGAPSSVFLNGQYLNSTPLIEKELKPGNYSLRIEPNDPELVPYETDISLKKSLLTVVTWKPAERPELSGGVVLTMEKLKDSSTTEVSFTSVPDGAIIALEGKEKDFTPVVFTDVEPGNRSFEITLPSYETQSHTISILPGYRTVVNLKLAKLLAVEESEPAAVEVGPGNSLDTTIAPTETATDSAASASAEATTSASVQPN